MGVNMMDEFSGSLRERVAVERLVSTPDDSGNAVLDWAEDGPAWAALTPADAGPALAGEGRVSRPRYRLTLRPRAHLGLASRFHWLGRVLTVVRIETDPRRTDRVTLLVEERSA